MSHTAVVEKVATGRSILVSQEKNPEDIRYSNSGDDVSFADDIFTRPIASRSSVL